MSYTTASYEDRQLLGVLWPASYNSEQNVPSSNFFDVSKYHRIAVEVFAGNIGTSLDVDVEIATDNAAANLHTLKSITQLTEAGSDDNSAVHIEIQSEELSKPTGATGQNYDFLRVEVTPSGATLVCVAVYGFVSRNKPVSTTIYDEIVD